MSDKIVSMDPFEYGIDDVLGAVTIMRNALHEHNIDWQVGMNAMMVSIVKSIYHSKEPEKNLEISLDFIRASYTALKKLGDKFP